MESNKYLEDISEIKNMMSRSSRFISLSGLSGVMAGVYALIGAFLAKLKLQAIANIDWHDLSGEDPIKIETGLIMDLFVIAMGVMVMAIATGIVLTMYKAHNSGEKIWNISSQRLVINFLIPLVTGGLFCIILYQNGFSSLISSTTLIFYGLACVNASKYTLGDVRYMGMAFIILGLISTQFVGYGLYFWALGFGLCHIVYGALMYFKYDRK